MVSRSRSSCRVGVIKLVKSIVLQTLVLCCLTSVWPRSSLLASFNGNYHWQGSVSVAAASNVDVKNSSASAWTSGSASNKKQVQVQPVADGKDSESTGLHVRSGSGILLEFVRKIQQLWASMGRGLIDFVLLRSWSPSYAHRQEDRPLIQDGTKGGGSNPPSKSGHTVVNNADAKGIKNALNDIPTAWNGVAVTEKEKQLLHELHEKRVALISKNCKASRTCKKTQTGHASSSWLEQASSTELLRFLRHKHGDPPNSIPIYIDPHPLTHSLIHALTHFLSHLPTLVSMIIHNPPVVQLPIVHRL